MPHNYSQFESLFSEESSDFKNLFLSEVNESENNAISWVKLKKIIEKFKEIANLNISSNIIDAFLSEDSSIFKENFDKK